MDNLRIDFEQERYDEAAYEEDRLAECVDALRDFALAHYEQGGEWVFETYDTGDYVKALEEAGWDVDAAKDALQDSWALISATARDIEGEADYPFWDGPEVSQHKETCY